MVEDNRYCIDISNQLLATQALLKSANQQILQAHIRTCVREALQTDEPNPKLEEALGLLEKMLQSYTGQGRQVSILPPCYLQKPFPFGVKVLQNGAYKK